MGKISITWKKSTIGSVQSHRATIASLGLRRLNQSVVHEDSPEIMGMVNKVRHLVTVEEAPTKSRKRTKAKK